MPTRLKLHHDRFDKTQPLIHMETSLQDSKTDRLALIKLNLLFTWKIHYKTQRQTDSLWSLVKLNILFTRRLYLHRFKERQTPWYTSTTYLHQHRLKVPHAQYSTLFCVHSDSDSALQCLDKPQPHIYTIANSKCSRYSSIVHSDSDSALHCLDKSRKHIITCD